MGRHAKGAVPLVQGEEERGEVQRDENPHPHGPVEGPHEGADGGCRVFAADLRRDAQFGEPRDYSEVIPSCIMSIRQTQRKRKHSLFIKTTISLEE